MHEYSWTRTPLTKPPVIDPEADTMPKKPIAHYHVLCDGVPIEPGYDTAADAEAAYARVIAGIASS